MTWLPRILTIFTLARLRISRPDIITGRAIHLLMQRMVVPPSALFTIDEVFGGWRKVEQIHFAKGKFFEQIQSN